MNAISWRRMLCAVLLPLFAAWTGGAADDLAQVRERGVLRHLGIPYANFNSGAGDGLDVEMMKRFAKHLGVKYEYVPTSWGSIIADLTGRRVKPRGDEIEVEGESEIKGDVIANGFTVLAWREKAVAYSEPTFPTQVWLIARADSDLKPIQPTKDDAKDIAATKARIAGLTVLGKAGTCLDPSLYGIAQAGATAKCFPGSLNDLAPALLKGEADALLLDVPDCLVALRKWPGKIKVIGPMSPQQQMATAFRPDAPELRKAFNAFFEQCKKDGTYAKLIRKYYPDVFAYYPEFFADSAKAKDASTPAAKAKDAGDE